MKNQVDSTRQALGMNQWTDPVTGLPNWKAQPKSVPGTTVPVEDALRAGVRVIIKRAAHMRALECDLPVHSFGMGDAVEAELIAWARRDKNREPVIRTANRWVEIGRIDLMIAARKLQDARYDLSKIPQSIDYAREVRLRRKALHAARDMMRLKTQQAERVFDLLR
jgi:hypothetical protein